MSTGRRHAEEAHHDDRKLLGAQLGWELRSLESTRALVCCVYCSASSGSPWMACIIAGGVWEEGFSEALIKEALRVSRSADLEY
jgi:hypothetical protein